MSKVQKLRDQSQETCTEWVRSYGGEAINIALNRCHFFKKKTLIFLPPPGPYPLRISSRSRDGNPGP